MTAQLLRRRLLPTLAVALACLGLFGLGRMVAHDVPGLGPAVAYADDLPQAQVEDVALGEVTAGRVTVGDQEVAMLVAAGGLEGHARAALVADRINQAIHAGLRAEDVTAEKGDGTYLVAARGNALVTVTTADAKALDESMRTLARRWAANLRAALGGESEDVGADNKGEWQPSEPYADKIVPILSLLEGTRVGMARVNGPTSRIAQTQGVAQFSIDFRSFLEIDLYVPISTKKPGQTLDRVQGVGVTGLGDLRL